MEMETDSCGWVGRRQEEEKTDEEAGMDGLLEKFFWQEQTRSLTSGAARETVLVSNFFGRKARW